MPTLEDDDNDGDNHEEEYKDGGDEYDDSSSNSAQSGSLATRSTVQTLDLVMAKRYAAYGPVPTKDDSGHNAPTPARRTKKQPWHDDTKNKEKMPPPPPGQKRRACSDVVTQFLLDEKRRQAGGYICHDLDTFAVDAPLRGAFVNRNQHHTTLMGHGDEDGSSAENNSLSTAPDPPSLRVRDHYLRPGAYRVKEDGEYRHADADSVVSSIRTHSTLRTYEKAAHQVGMGIPVEATLVVDDENYMVPPEPLPPDEYDKRDDPDYPLSSKPTTAEPDGVWASNGYDSSNQHDGGVNRSSSSNPPPPPSPVFAVHMGDVTCSMTAASAMTPVVEAHAYNEPHTLPAFFRSRKVRCLMCTMGMIFVVLSMGIAIAATRSGTQTNQSNMNTNGDGTLQDEENDNNMEKTLLDSLVPSSAPTSMGDLDLEYFVEVALPEYTQAAVRIENSPQRRALMWLKNNTRLESYPLSRRLQRFSLATLFFSTGGERRWSSNAGWLSDADECDWFNVNVELPTCVEDEYKVLSLTSNQLRGTLPQEIELLSSLEMLLLDENIVSGYLPTTLGNLPAVKEINLFDNYISGTIPPELADLSTLQVLNLEYNFLAQTLPSSLGKMASLEELLVDRNSLAGGLPEEYGNLSRLEVFHAYDNLLSGTIPNEYMQLSSLRELEFDLNLFHGRIPVKLESWDQIRSLNLGNNSLTGGVPSEIGAMIELTAIDFFLNNLTEPIPSEIGSLKKLQKLYFEANSIGGGIPTQIGELVSLKTLWLFLNLITGPLPTEIGQLQQLEDLDLSRNNFSGVLPTEIGLLTNLQELYLNGNKFSGSIPSELGLLSTIRSIRLHGNNFTGNMSAEVCDLIDIYKLPPENITVDCDKVICGCCRCY